MAIKIRSRAIERQGSIEVINQDANHSQSMEILAKHGLRPLTYQEALSRSSEFIKTLKGKWFYLKGQGMEKSGIHTFNEKGELIELTGNESIDQKVHVWPGNKPLSLDVLSDVGARVNGRRLGLGGDVSPNGVAPVVVGVKAGREAAAPKNSAASQVPKQSDIFFAEEALLNLERSPFVQEGELSAIRERLEAAKAQRRK
jgi:hypothetical protein